MPLDEHGREPGSEHYGEPGHAGEPADAHGKDGKGTPAGGAKKGDKKTGVLIILTAAGVVIAYLTLRSRSSASSSPPAGSSANNAANYPAASPGTGDVAGASTGADTGFQYLIANLQGEVAQLIAAQTTPTTGSTSGPPTSPSSGTYQPGHPVTGWYRGLAGPLPSAPRFIGGAAGKALPEISYGGAIYEVNPGGGLYHLTPNQYASLGKPAPIAIPTAH